MLCGVSVVFNSLDDVLGLMSCKRSSENGQVLVGFDLEDACIEVSEDFDPGSGCPHSQLRKTDTADRRGGNPVNLDVHLQDKAQAFAEFHERACGPAARVRY